MVGAFSIVRFRPLLKISDTIYMFWAIAVGIGSGVGMHKSRSRINYVRVRIGVKDFESTGADHDRIERRNRARFSRIVEALRNLDRKISSG